MLSERAINLIFLVLNAIVLVAFTLGFEKSILSEEQYQGSFTIYAKYFRLMRSMIEQDVTTRRMYYQQLFALYILPPFLLIFPTGFKLLFGQNSQQAIWTSFGYIVLILGGYWLVVRLTMQFVRSNRLWQPQRITAEAAQTLVRALLAHYAKQLRRLQANLVDVDEGTEQVQEWREARSKIVQRAQHLKHLDQADDQLGLSKVKFTTEELGYLDNLSAEKADIMGCLIIFAMRYDVSGAFELLSREFAQKTAAEKHQDYLQYYKTQVWTYWLVVGITGIQVVLQLF